MFNSVKYTTNSKKFLYNHYINPSDELSKDYTEILKYDVKSTKIELENSLNIIKDFYQNRKNAQHVDINWLNTVEILNYFDLIQSGSLIFLHNELPGNNLFAINHYCVSKNIIYNWKASVNKKNMVDTYKLHEKYAKNFIDKKDVDVQLSSLDISLCMLNMNISIDVNADKLLEDLFTILKILSRSGDIVFKIISINPFISSIIILLSHLFMDVYVVNTIINGSKSHYIICRNFNGLTTKIIEYFNELIKLVRQYKIDDKYSLVFCVDNFRIKDLGKSLGNLLKIKNSDSLWTVYEFIKKNNLNKIENGKKFQLLESDIVSEEGLKFNLSILNMARENYKDLPVNYDNIFIVGESEYSSPLPFHILSIIEGYKQYLPKDINIILDLTSHIGLDSMLLASVYNTTNTQINMVELNSKTAEILTANFNNLDIILRDKYLGKWNITNASALDYIKTMNKVDLVYADPPWGGKEYLNNQKMDLYLDKTSISDVVFSVLPNTRYFVLKIPRNFDIDSFSKKLVDSMEIIVIYDIYKPNKIDISYKVIYMSSKLYQK